MTLIAVKCYVVPRDIAERVREVGSTVGAGGILDGHCPPGMVVQRDDYLRLVDALEAAQRELDETKRAYSQAFGALVTISLASKTYGGEVDDYGPFAEGVASELEAAQRDAAGVRAVERWQAEGNHEVQAWLSNEGFQAYQHFCGEIVPLDPPVIAANYSALGHALMAAGLVGREGDTAAAPNTGERA